MIRKVAFAAALIALTTSCRYAIPPEPSEALGNPVPIVAPVLNENLGVLFLTDDGLWAWRHENRKKESLKLSKAQVVIFGDLDETKRHVFVVVDIFDWGALLQRLDSGPVGSRNSGSLVPLNALGFQTAQRWNLCVGFDTSPLASPCLDEAPPGTLWDVYPMKNAEKLVVRDVEKPRMPVERAQIIWSGGTKISHGKVPGNEAWLAVPSVKTTRPPLPSVLLDSSCPAFDLPKLTVVRSKVEADNILSVTARAYENGVDALVQCDGEEIEAHLPSFFRRTLPATDERLAIPSMLSIESIEIEGSRAARSDAITAYAYLGAGDAGTAEFYFERAVGGMDESDEFGLRSMDVAASVGRPEAGIRRGRQATDSAWNRDANPFWRLGLAHVYRALRKTGEFNEIIVEIPSAAHTAGEANLSAWLAWIELRRKLNSGAPPQKVALNELLDRTAAPEFEAWRTAFKFEVLRRQELADIESLGPDLEKAEAKALADAYLEVTVALPCEAACKLDAYGRRWPSLTNLAPATRLERIERAPWASFAPGFEMAVDLDAMEAGLDAAQATRFWAASLEYLSTDTAEAAREKLLGAVVRLARTCSPGELSKVDGTARSIDASIASDDDSATEWLGTTGLVASCRGLDALVEAAESYKRVGALDAPGALFTALLERTDDAEAYRETLVAAARYGSTYEKGPRCERWNLSLSAAAAQAGRLEAARRFASAAAECKTSEFAETESLILAFLNFERTRSISRDFKKEVVEALETLVHQRLDEDKCAGVQPFGYDVLSRLDPDVRTMAMKLALVRKPIEDLDLVKSSDSVTEAQKRLDVARKSFAAAKPDVAWDALSKAHDDFERVRHLPGLAITRFVRAAAFGERETYDIERDKRAARGEKREWNLRRGLFDSLEEKTPAERLFVAWVEGGSTGLEKAVAEVATRPETLCTAPNFAEPEPGETIVIE